MAVVKKRIGEMLLEAGIIDETQLKAALGHQRQWGVRLGQALVDLKLATEADIVRALSLKFGFEVAKLDSLEPYGHEQALKLFPRDFAIRNNVFPMWADTANVTVAMSDPTNLAVVDEVRFRTGRRVKVCIGGDHEIADAVKRHYHAEGAVEAIALDLDADSGVAGEAVFDPFGGGSKDALEAFFGGGPEAGAATAEATAPPAAAAPAPVAAAATAPAAAAAAVPAPAPAAAAAPAPAATAPAAGPAVAPSAPAPARAAPRTATGLPAQPAPASAAPRAQPAAQRPAGAPAPVAAPAAARPQPTAAPAAPAPAPRPVTAQPGAAAPPQRAPAVTPRPPTTSVPAVRTPTSAGVPAPAPVAPPRAATATPAQAPATPAAQPVKTVAQVAGARPAAPRAAVAELELEEKTGDHTITEELTPIGEPTTGEIALGAVAAAERQLTPREKAIVESLERLASGQPAQPDIVKPTQAMAALIRLLVRKGVVTEFDFLDELNRK